MRTYFGIDPGGTTGVCIVEGGWEFGQISGEAHHKALFDLLVERQPSIVICEHFTYRRDQRTNLDLRAREYIGVAALYCQITDTELVMQMPAHAKGLIDNKKAKILNIYKPGKPHATDAARHVMYYMIVKEKNRKYLDALKGK